MLFRSKVANDLFRSMNLAQSGLNLDTDDLKQAGNLGLWKTVPKFDAARGMKFLTYAAPAIRNAMMDMIRDAFAAFEQRMVTEDKDGICYQRVSLDDVLPGEEQLQRIEAIADPYAMQPQSIMEDQESRRELYDGLKRLTQREQTYLLYRYGFTDGKEHPLIGTAIYFHLTKGRAQKTEEQAMDNLWLELPWWFTDLHLSAHPDFPLNQIHFPSYRQVFRNRYFLSFAAFHSAISKYPLRQSQTDSFPRNTAKYVSSQCESLFRM